MIPRFLFNKIAYRNVIEIEMVSFGIREIKEKFEVFTKRMKKKE
jgi:hypothetical protein